MSREKLGITLTSELLQRLMDFCEKKGLSKSQGIAFILSEYLNQEGASGGAK